MSAPTWFRHDTTALHDRKLQELFRLGGYAHIGRWWAVVEALAAEADCCIRGSHIEATAFKLRMDPEELREFLDLCSDIGLLQKEFLEVAGLYLDRWWSDSLLGRMSEIHKARDKKREQRAQGARLSPGQSQGQKLDPSGTEKRTVPISGSNPSTQIQSNPLNSDPRDKTAETVPAPRTEPPAERPDEFEKYRKYLGNYLSEPTDPPEPWQNENLFISGGKRPLRKWPRVWLSVNDMLAVFRRYDESIEGEDKGRMLNAALDATQSAAELHVAAGRPLTSFQAFSHLTSWKLQDQLNAKTAAVRLVNSTARGKEARLQ